MITSLPTILAAGKVDALVEKFGLAWPKFFAQVIIFWIVFSILKKYAFGPILGMLEQRRQRIADGEAKLEKMRRTPPRTPRPFSTRRRLMQPAS
jgi:F-type H+-transporting ATPase subunit b